jgi:type 1 glutamine amidotransferase
MRLRTAGLVALLALIACDAAPSASPSPSSSPTEPTRVLVFTRTAAFRHASIPDAVSAIRRLGEERGLVVDATENASRFTDATLSRYRAVVFLLTSGDVLNDVQQEAFERYIRAGGGYAGVHSASDTEYDWAWYGRLVGAYFKAHPAVQAADVIVEDRAHPSTTGLPARWHRTDEWYNFRTNPRSSVHVLARLDEATYNGGTMGSDHPWAWCHTFESGRAWYTAGGHASEAYEDPAFLGHVLGGIGWAAGREAGDCSLA